MVEQQLGSLVEILKIDWGKRSGQVLIEFALPVFIFLPSGATQWARTIGRTHRQHGQQAGLSNPYRRHTSIISKSPIRESLVYIPWGKSCSLFTGSGKLDVKSWLRTWNPLRATVRYLPLIRPISLMNTWFTMLVRRLNIGLSRWGRAPTIFLTAFLRNLAAPCLLSHWRLLCWEATGGWIFKWVLTCTLFSSGQERSIPNAKRCNESNL